MIGLLPTLPLLTFLFGHASDHGAHPHHETVTSPRVAQVRLAETLAAAEAIEAVTAHKRTVTFSIVDAGTALEVTAKTSPSGEVLSLTIAPAPGLGAQLHGLTWLGAELAEATAVTRLVVDEDGGVMIATDAGRRYMAIPGRGSGGADVAAEARWAAAWSADDDS